MNCTVAASVTDAETLQEISLNDKEFYGSDADEEVSVSRATAGDSEDEYLSPNDDEEDTQQAARGLSLPEGTQASLASSKDSEFTEITDHIERGCGCSEDCYRQFSAGEILDSG